MQTVRSFEKSVKDIEGFDVRICKGGKKVRGDRKVNFEYAHRRRAPNSATVSKYLKRSNRFDLGDDMYVEVLDNDGNAVHGRTKLNTVRKSYI